MKRVARILAIAIGALLSVGAFFLAQAHIQIRTIDPPIPEVASVLALTPSGPGPVALRVVNTATQGIEHPAFVLGWPDGRLFLFETGMDREGARAFGAPMERFVGAAPIEPHGSVAEQMGDDILRVQGVAFSHLHHDHTGGVVSLCQATDHLLPRFHTRLQAETRNYTTRPGAALLEEATCLVPKVVEGRAPAEISGFPGLFLIPAGGHTPGSTVLVATLPDRTWIFAGDIQNQKDDLLANRPKAWAYSALITPEWPDRLERLRRWLIALDAAPGATVIVSHDVDAARRDGVPDWPGAGRD